MSDRVTLPEDRDRELRTITDGFFEREVYLSRNETAAFLRDLADQLEADTSITVAGSDWEIPFEYRDPIEVEIEFTKQRERELEIELEFSEDSGGKGLSIR
ncbi:amphi-Trp domain-containing protein [Halostagnicola sp. A-GB9-2]|uniref:amphi-Trp domain-containing protein n=1 Tax=Halostagnicola sp. A-GB9-2 TaxID=3048066 RepID=UPI0024BF3173|nr:amphi-Trp domain-containing protein [Halostagnicola sp. A-GB9-2]MDJ1434150.1 amphi-Trp domain-containing protein [Halostagnicola sp. A-GB9-2]